jgi:hypothetical protein
MNARRVLGYSVLWLILLLAPAASSSPLPWVGTYDSGATGPVPTSPSAAWSRPAPDGESLSPLCSAWRRLTNGQAPAARLRRALQRAREAETFRVDIDLQQTITLLDASPLGTGSEYARFQIEGTVGGPERARFSILPAAASFALATQDPQEVLIVDSTIYRRVEGRWVETESAPSVVALDGDGLSLLSVARDVHSLEPADDVPSDFRGVGFTLQPDDVTRFVLLQHDRLDPEGVMLARLAAPAISGSGELWIDGAGLPARLTLNLSWVKEGRDPYRVHAATTTHYWDFGRRFPPERFDPAASPETGAPLAGSSDHRGAQPPLWPAVGAGLLALFWLLARAAGGSRRATVTVTLTLILALLAPSVAPAAQAAGLGEPAAKGRVKEESPPPSGSEVVRMLEQTRALAAEHRIKAPPGQGNLLLANDDEDGDGLPNGYEIQLGTNPLSKDSDYDGLSDDDEVQGMRWEHGGQIKWIETNPLDPDSNHDGLRDGDEYAGGTCASDYEWGCAWDDDNDNDDVPDGLDLSPFSKSGALANESWESGPSLTFETLDQDPSEDRRVPYPFYVEIQIRPLRADTLRLAYKHLYWPLDYEGPIQRPNPVEWETVPVRSLAAQAGVELVRGGRLTLAPFLQATLRARDLPSDEAMAQYGIGSSPHKDEQGNPVVENGEALYDITIPLVPVERGGQIFAFQAKMLHDGGRNNELLRHWRDLRLKWAVTGDVEMPGVDPGPSGEYGLALYDAPYRLTGLQVSRQGGASTLLAAALPPSDAGTLAPPPWPSWEYNDDRIALLRAGMEAQFLTGQLGLRDIKDRFDDPSSASDEQRWGIPQTWEYRVKHDTTMVYDHLDEAVATTTMTTTRQLLDEVYAKDKDLEPTLILASEQRTSTVNLDDDPTSDYSDITINTCIKPLITSRSLQLQTYRWVPHSLVSAADGWPDGDWEPLTLDEILQKVEEEFAEVTDPLDEFYNEALNILKMATTAWHMGQTAILALGDLMVQDPAEMILSFLDELGFLPTGYKTVVEAVLGVLEAGGPLAWLEQQWNRIVGVVSDTGEILEGGFLDGTSGFDLLEWTQTAINVLNFMAMITGWEALAEVATILTKLVQIYQKIRALWDAVKAIMDTMGGALESAAGMLIGELDVLGEPMLVMGLILNVGMIWAAVLAQLGNVGASIAAALVGRAIVQTILTVVLAVLSAMGPIGAFVAAAIGILNLLGDLLGVTTLDPLTAFFNWFFGEQRELATRVAEFGGPAFIGDPKTEPVDPGGTILAGRRFRITLYAETTMRTANEGTPSDLEKSEVRLHVGRYLEYQTQPHGPYEPEQPTLCTADPDLFARYKEALGGRVFETYSDGVLLCARFSLLIGHWPYWNFEAETHVHPYPIVDVDPGGWHRAFGSTGWVDMTPVAGINQPIDLDVSMDVKYRYTAWRPCCGYTTHTAVSTSAPAISRLTFDILPGRLTGDSVTYGPGLWDWPDVHNPDPDGDGLVGYRSSPGGDPVGADADLCPNHPGRNSWELWDTDWDGLSDLFELETEGFDPCLADTDHDTVPDGVELMVGTRPDVKDTDGDGLNDVVEIPCSRSVYGEEFCLEREVYPWRVAMTGFYPSLPDPVAFPNPRQANLDRDHRGDSQEKDKLSSPNAYNAIPVGDPIALWIRQGTLSDGTADVGVGTPAWQNEEAFAINPTLTITLPVTFSDVELSASVLPPAGGQVPWWADQAELLPPQTPDVYQWKLPPLWSGRYVHAYVRGVPEPPSGPVTVTAQLSYSEADVLQVATQSAPLRINTGGPSSSPSGVYGAVVLEGVEVVEGGDHIGGEVTISGTAYDAEQVSQVYVCVKDTDDDCAAEDWELARGTDLWSYTFTPPADDVYTVRTYAVDGDGIAGPVSEPWVIGVDQTPPYSLGFDLHNTAYLSTTISADGPRIITLTGWISDTTGTPFVSGADDVIVLADGEVVDAVSVAEQGQSANAFAARWAPPWSGFGRSMRSESGAHILTVLGGDVAGNASPISDTVQVVVDDTPPLVYAQLPQTAGETALALSGLADDTALIYDRQPTDPFTATLTLDDSDTRLAGVDVATSEAVVVGDVNSDGIDDGVFLAPGSAEAELPLQAGLFFGRPGRLPDTLPLADADVLLLGDVPTAPWFLYPRAAGVGDVNGDGVDDLLIGDSMTQYGWGGAYLILGKRGSWEPSLSLAEADWLLDAPPPMGEGVTMAFGASVSPVGDTNGDGLSDFLVGAANSGPYNGVAWLYLGQEQGVAAPRAALYGLPDAGLWPPNLAGLGDTNGDGLSDFLIAAEYGPPTLILGRPATYWPVAPASALDLAAALLGASGDQQTVSPAGDVNGDGLQDMLIGDPYAEEPKVYVVFGRRPERGWPSGPFIPRLEFWADAYFSEIEWPSSRLGLGLAALGDLDGDGADDFAFGQPGEGAGPNRAAVVLTGRLSLERDMPVESAATLISGSFDGQMCGTNLSGGDVSGDHIPDLLVGTGGDGEAHLFLGAFDPGFVAGLSGVKLGAYGPLEDATLPLTATLPSAWSNAALGQPADAISSWAGSVPVSGDGDYRVYARARDRAGNQLGPAGWYLGDVCVNTSGYTPIYSIQETTHPTGDSPLAGDQVTTEGIVTARFQHGYSIQDPESGPWSGLWVYDTHTPTLGDRLRLTGTVHEYQNETELVALTDYQVESSGNPLPDPEILPTGAVSQEQWEGVLVRVENVTVEQEQDIHDDWVVNDGTGGVWVDDLGSYAYVPTLGDRLDFVQGPLVQIFDWFLIEPRDDADIAVAPLDYTPIYEIQETSDPSGDSPLVGEHVTTEGIVTARFQEVYSIQDPAGGAWSGLWVYDANTPEVGDRLRLTGTVDEYYGLTELTDLTAYDVESFGNPVPGPEVLPTGDVSQEKWEGVFVRVVNVTVEQEQIAYGEWIVNDGSGPVWVDDMGSYTFVPTMGRELDYVQGPVCYSYGEFKIEPRHDEDIAAVPLRVEIQGGAQSFLAGSLTMDPPQLSDQTELSLTGELSTDAPVQYMRVYDGYRWHRVSPDVGEWSVDSSIPRSEQQALTFRAVARDAFGATLHTSRTLTVDSLVGDEPLLSANLPTTQWQTDVSPTLVISWTEASDAAGIAGTWAVIDTDSDTRPTTPVYTDSIELELSEPGIYYGHVRVQDGVGNEDFTHAGPFPVNRTRTPSVILPDGALDLSDGEWPSTTLLNYDPYARFKPAALWGTWDHDWLYLGYPDAGWGPGSRLAIYLDTQAGGLTTAMAPVSGTHAHTLPFAADFAFTVGGSSTDPYTLHTADLGEWTPMASPLSFAVRSVDTEMVLMREEIDAYGPVRLLAFAEDSNGVWAVLPAGARPTTAEVITGPIAFQDSFYWPGLESGVEPREGQSQVIAPDLNINPPWDNVLISGQTTAFTVTVRNPDVGAYEDVPLTIQTSPLMELTGVNGAPCISCPAGTSRWVLAADVAGGSTQTVTINALTTAEGVSGVLPMTVTAELAGSGLPMMTVSGQLADNGIGSEPLFASGQYFLDHGVGEVDVFGSEALGYAQSGDTVMRFTPSTATMFYRCWQMVEANTGSGWTVVGPMGDRVALSAYLPPDSSETWQVRVASACGRRSEPIVRTMIADDVVPMARITPTLYLTSTFAFLRGTALDGFPTTRTPQRVEVSVNGGRYQLAVVSADGDGGSSRANWLFPVEFSDQDGEVIEVVARAVDEAGNVGPSTTPIAITVDNSGPALTHAVDDRVLGGTAMDGSGVASVEVSLDGGVSYEPATLGDGSWSYSLPPSPGFPELDFALIRARDQVGNTTHEVAFVAPVGFDVYLPLVTRSG